MQATMELLLQFHGPDAKVVVWAHNTHIGGANETDMANEGMYNIGELARKTFPEQTFLIGFGSNKGDVIAGRNWGDKMKTMVMPDAKKGSWEYLLHKAGNNNKLFTGLLIKLQIKDKSSSRKGSFLFKLDKKIQC